MTLPEERRSAIINTRKFLTNLLINKEYYNSKTSVKKIRKRARELLKHYPVRCELENLNSMYGDL